MKRIFISTSNDLHGLFGDREYQSLELCLEKSGLKEWEEFKIVSFNESSHKFEEFNTQHSIVLIEDKSNDCLRNVIINEDDYLLHHSLEEIHHKHVLPKFNGRVRKGNHIIGREYYYSDVFKIIFDEDGNKVERVLKALKLRPEDVQDELNFSDNIKVWKELSLLEIKILRHGFSGLPKEISKLEEFKKVENYDQFKNAKEEFWKNHLAQSFESGQSSRAKEL